MVFQTSADAPLEISEETKEKKNEEEMLSELGVPESEFWQGDWLVPEDSPFVGNLIIYNETEEGFDFHITVKNNEPMKTENSSKLRISSKVTSGYANKDGFVALSDKDPNGCELTFRFGKERILVTESEECADPDFTVDYNQTFTPPETFVIDEHFLESIKQGKFTPEGYGIGNSIRSIIHELGEPDAEIQRNEASYTIYSNIGYGTTAGDNIVGLLTVIRPEKLTPTDIEELLGEPEQQGLNELEGLYFYYYIIENEYELYFEFIPEEKTLLRFHLREFKLM
ncbi:MULTISPECIES: DUF4309 domain-containing protein [unclassified Sutcliffiella]|uniref:DUF4309 domain-containing protein n=1 Tax=unclassified Sutcliffiella TaxID=2837532 RepID=UPI0030CF09B9